MALQRPNQQTSDSITEQDLQRDEITVLNEAKIKLEEAKKLLEHVQASQGKASDLITKWPEIKAGFVSHFAGALSKLEGDNGAISKIKAAQSYAHAGKQEAEKILAEARQGSPNIRPLQVKIRDTHLYLEQLDLRIEALEGELVAFLNESKKKCEDEQTPNNYFRYRTLAQSAITSSINPLIGFIEKDMLTAKRLFTMEIAAKNQSIGKTGWRKLLPF